MKSRIGALVLFSLALGVASPPAGAQDAAVIPPDATSRDPLPFAAPPQATPAPPTIQADAHGTRYVSGGVSLEERDLMRDLARGFPLRIVSARPDGSLVPNVALTISDSRGRPVLEVSDVGPRVYVAVPPGSYKVKLNRARATESRSVTVGGGQQRELAFFWRGQREEYTLLQPWGSPVPQDAN